MSKPPRVSVQCTSCKATRTITRAEEGETTFCRKCGNLEKAVRPARRR